MRSSLNNTHYLNTACHSRTPKEAQPKRSSFITWFYAQFLREHSNFSYTWYYYGRNGGKYLFFSRGEASRLIVWHFDRVDIVPYSTGRLSLVRFDSELRREKRLYDNNVEISPLVRPVLEIHPPSCVMLLFTSFAYQRGVPSLDDRSAATTTPLSDSFGSEKSRVSRCVLSFRTIVFNTQIPGSVINRCSRCLWEESISRSFDVCHLRAIVTTIVRSRMCSTGAKVPEPQAVDRFRHRY